MQITKINHNICGIFKITKANWQSFKDKKSIVLHLQSSEKHVCKVTLFYKDNAGNLLHGYPYLQSIMTLLNLPFLSISPCQDNAYVCPELLGKNIGLYLHKDDYFVASHNKYYENLAITAVYDPMTQQFADEAFFNNATRLERHQYYSHVMHLKTQENELKIRAEIEKTKHF